MTDEDQAPGRDAERRPRPDGPTGRDTAADLPEADAKALPNDDRRKTENAHRRAERSDRPPTGEG